jgi:DNA-binding PadR family transcriptional regulator
VKLPSPKELELLALISTKELTGREVALRYKAETGRSISYGTLYTTFRRLKEAGWVESRDDRDRDGRVRFFRLSASGARILKQARNEYARLATFGSRRLGEVGA